MVCVENKMETDLDPAVVDEGTALVEELLKAWSNAISAQDGEDVIMADGDDDNDDPEAQLAELRKCMAEFQPRLEGNAWVQQVLASLA